MVLFPLKLSEILKEPTMRPTDNISVAKGLLSTERKAEFPATGSPGD